MIRFNVFPGGKKRCVTFSYDDGCDNDARLIELFNRYGMKGTFHLNGINYLGYSDAQLKEVGKLYEGHEISCHTYSHCYPTLMQDQSVVTEIMEDRRVLEKIAGYPMVGLSYPAGSCSEHVAQVLSSCGMKYGRTTKSTHDFLMPRSFMLWHPTCHHDDPRLMELADTFLAEGKRPVPKLFYLWGHSFEFEEKDNWHVIEEFFKRIAGREDVWYATNIQVYDYKQAFDQLIWNVDCTKVYNPTATDLWFHAKKQIHCVKGGQTLSL